MAKEIKIGVKIEADGKQLTGVARLSQRELDQLSRSAKASSNHVKGLAQSYGILKKALVVGTVTAFVHQLNQSADAMDRIGKQADKIGLTTDELQALRFAGEQTGVATNNLDLSMQRFSRRVGEAAQGQGELKGVLEQYNIAVVDSEGKTRKNVDILGDLADRVKGAASEQEKLRIVFKAFDSEGAALVNTLRNGSEGLQGYLDKARELGLIIDEEAIRASEAFNDSLGRLTARLITMRTEALAPVIVKLNELFDQFDGKDTVITLTADANNIVDKIELIDKELARVRLLRINPFASDADLESDKQRLLADLADVKKRLTGAISESSNAPAKRSSNPVINPVDQSGLKSLQSLDANLKQQVATLGQGREAVLRYRLTLGDLAKQVAASGESGEALKLSILAQAAALDAAQAQAKAAAKAESERQARIAEGKAIAESVLTPYEKLIQTESRLNDLRRRGVVSQETLNRAIGAARKAYDDANPLLAEARELYKSTLTPLEQYNQKVARLNQLRDEDAFKGAGGFETYQRALKAAKDELDSFNSKQEEASEFARQAARNVQDAWAEFFFDPFNSSAEDILLNLSNALRRTAAESLAAQTNQLLLGGGFEKTGKPGGLIGGLLGTSSGDAKANEEVAQAGITAGEQVIADTVKASAAESVSKTIAQSAADAVKSTAASQAQAITVQAAIAAQTTALVASMQANTAQIVAAVSASAGAGSASSLALSGGGTSSFGSAFSSFLPSFHTTGISEREQLAVLLKKEEVIAPTDPRHSQNPSRSSERPMDVSITINATDGPSVLRSKAQIERELMGVMSRAQRNA